jgi:hypothetical protein
MGPPLPRPSTTPTTRHILAFGDFQCLSRPAEGISSKTGAALTEIASTAETEMTKVG